MGSGGRFCAGAMLVVSLVLAMAATGAAQAPPAQPPPVELSPMVRLPGGTFLMGSDKGLPDERPVHAVTLAPFHIDVRPVTNRELAAFLQTLGGGVRNGRGQRLFDDDDGDARIRKRGGRWQADPGWEMKPAIEMSWYGARDFCAWAGKRLPTEAEWEFAARGAAGRTYPWGEGRPDATRARFAAGWSAFADVGSFPKGATPEGILDLAGNVHQWTSSLARPYPWRPDDGREHPDLEADRVTRGGAADTGPQTLRATWRGGSVSRAPRAGHHNIGMRCARDG